jgi:hypothetical protein
MIISESQVKAIISEEIKKMIAEGEIEEGWFSDKVGSLGKKFVGGAARMAGLTSGELANQEAAAAAEAEAEQADELSASKEEARAAAMDTIAELSQQLLEIETDGVEALRAAAGPLRYRGGGSISVKPFYDAIGNAQSALETLKKDIMGRAFKSRRTGHYNYAQALAERKNK